MSRQADLPTLLRGALACLAVGVIALHSSPLSAQSTGIVGVYRCGNGHYAQHPCDDTAQRLPDVAAPSSAQQREQASVHKRERQLAKQLQRDREKWERQHRPTQGPSSLTGPVRQVAVGENEPETRRTAARTKKRESVKLAERLRPQRDRDFVAKTPRTASASD